MCDVIKVCAVCKKEIEIDINNIHGVARAKSDYYHPDCLIQKAEKCIKRAKHDKCWDYVINHISECEQDAKEVIYKRYWQDKLNEHLLKYYDIITFPDRFWEMVVDLNAGIYKGKRCKAVSMDLLYHTWAWGQRKLNAIALNNKKNHKGPKNDSDRLGYDLAIVLSKVPNYIAYKNKIDAEEAERKKAQEEKVKINYNNIAKTTETQNYGLDDISGLLDDMF